MLSQSEIRGPWMMTLECGHLWGPVTRPYTIGHCELCGQSPVVSAHYGKRPIPINDLKWHYHTNKPKGAKKKPAPKPTAPAREHHRDFRQSLIRDGWTPESADRATMEYRWNGLRKRAGDERYRRVRERLDGPRRLSDARYRPTHIDPLLKGVARATGETAKAIRSGKTITNWQHRERV